MQGEGYHDESVSQSLREEVPDNDEGTSLYVVHEQHATQLQRRIHSKAKFRSVAETGRGLITFLGRKKWPQDARQCHDPPRTAEQVAPYTGNKGNVQKGKEVDTHNDAPQLLKGPARGLVGPVPQALLVPRDAAVSIRSLKAGSLAWAQKSAGTWPRLFFVRRAFEK